MPDSLTASGRRAYAASLAAGLISSLLYVSIFLTFAFLLPIQLMYGRYGRKQGRATAGISAAGIALIQAGRLVTAQLGGSAAQSGSPAGVLDLAYAFIPAIALIAALVFMNAGLGKQWKPVYKAFIGAALCALALIPMIVSIESDAQIASYLESRVADFLQPLKGAAGEGYDASALMAALDPKELVSSSLIVIESSFAAFLFFLIAGSWRIGNRLSGIESRGWEETAPIDELRLPFALVWAFLGSWFAVLGSVAIKAPVAVSAVAWNCALILSFAYAGQGLGIIVHLFKSWNMPKSMRILIAILAAMSIVTPLGLGLAAALPLFGVTEIWIPYRKLKGVGA
jgi:Predicted membrane protein (DUF2232).